MYKEKTVLKMLIVVVKHFFFYNFVECRNTVFSVENMNTMIM